MPARRRTLGPIVLALLLGLSAGFVSEALLHTDDGCALERHCLTCQRVASSTALVAAPVTFSAVLAPSAAVEQPRQARPPEIARRCEASRGPPSA